MGGRVCYSLHEAEGCYRCCVYREGSQHADQVAFEKCTHSSQLVLFSETLSHRLILELSEFIRLHQSLDIVEGIVEDPIKGSSNTS